MAVEKINEFTGNDSLHPIFAILACHAFADYLKGARNKAEIREQLEHRLGNFDVWLQCAENWEIFNQSFHCKFN